ncbi:MAG: 6-carboxytetrahydropterin synthase [Bacteroidales bacterium]|jgi:6-pyruvoyltetrahydropterin/6-carboxytetrahydropterin synthase|nr:6-carboxytetrahydropterin synthase [Bacteroidales bacterium]MCI1786141.1 6-carboxytetrahydropterin synthase [Bacteroidales bacterium]
MYYVTKRLEISAAHALKLSYESKCETLHGHNWIIKVHCKSGKLNADGMVTDFTEIKKKINGTLDHRNLNEVLDFNPTAENIAKWVCDNIPNCYKVEVWESESNLAVYEKDEG